MVKCAICGKREYLMYRCNYCLQYFCSKHRLPENHLCPGLPKRGWKQVRNRRTIKKRSHRKPRIKNKPQRNNRREKPKKARVWIVVSLIIIGLTATFYMSNPEGFITTLYELTNNQSSIYSNITDSIKDQFNNITFPESIFIPENVYGNYSFGLVKGPEGVTVNSYRDYVVLINNNKAVNPTYDQLVNFLKKDKTDEYIYTYTISSESLHYGPAESNVNLTFVKDIVDGVEDLIIPRTCGDFAQRLHNVAELTGIRCGYVSIDLIGYTDPYDYGISSNVGHALNVFNTTDKGLIYIDDTGGRINGPSNHDSIVNELEIGKPYVPIKLFRESGWKSNAGSMGDVKSIFITWDGDWD